MNRGRRVRARGRGAPDRRPVRARLAFRGQQFSDRVSRDLTPLEELLLRHALGEDPAPYQREDAASGVMMIPIPKRGILRQRRRRRRRARGRRHRRDPHHREARSTAGAAARGRELSGIHLRARRARPTPSSRRCAHAHARLRVRHRSRPAGARPGANTLQSPSWLIPADRPRRSRRPARRPTPAAAR